jgi:sn-glycerol 3-phosphate transport system permease protein
MRAGPARVRALAFLAPSLALFAVFFVYPILSCLWLSLHRWDLLGEPRWVGARNYEVLLSGGAFGPVLGRTLLYAAGTVAGSMAAGLSLALAVHRSGRIGGAIRSAIFASYVVSWVGVSLLWSYLLDGAVGPVSGAARSLGLPAPDWLGDPDLALVSLVLVSIWKVVGYDMVLYLAALEDVPPELREAAALDGATRAQTFRHVVWPLLRPTTAFLLVTGTIMSFQGFDVVRVMTGGGPADATQIYVHWVYEQAFAYFRLGPACAAVVLFLVPLGLLTWLGRRVGRGEGVL